jgi:hypothetical protein
MSKYSRGENVPGPVVAFRIAELLGDQPAAVIADLETERAERDGKDEDADYLRALRKALMAAGASILLMAGSAGFSNADAALRHLPDASTDQSSYRSRKKRRGGGKSHHAGPWDGLLRRSVALRARLSELVGMVLPTPLLVGYNLA